MEDPVRCAESVRVQAHLDGELDAIASLNIEQHMSQCDECRELFLALGRTRAMLKDRLSGPGASASLRAQIQNSLDREDASHRVDGVGVTRQKWEQASFWWGSLAGAAATVAVAAVVLFLMALPAANPYVDAVLEAHVSSLASAHLIDVVSTDRHTVKPWFAGRVDVSPVVADFSAQGYRLTGGRVDSLGRQHAAVTVYRHGAHVINVFCWVAPKGPLPGNANRVGFHLAFWKSADLAYAAVSDTGWDELLALERLLRAQDAAESSRAVTLPGTE